jgi:hypothetical protein
VVGIICKANKNPSRAFVAPCVTFPAGMPHSARRCPAPTGFQMPWLKVKFRYKFNQRGIPILRPCHQCWQGTALVAAQKCNCTAALPHLQLTHKIHISENVDMLIMYDK